MKLARKIGLAATNCSSGQWAGDPVAVQYPLYGQMCAFPPDKTNDPHTESAITVRVIDRMRPILNLEWWG